MSVKGQILRAVTSILSGLKRPGGSALEVRIRKRLDHDKAYESKRAAVVVPLKEKLTETHSEDNAFFVYPVLVALVQGRDIRLEDIDWEADMTESVRKALHRIFLPGTPVWGCEYDGNPSFDAGALTPMFAVSAQRFDYATSERRIS